MASICATAQTLERTIPERVGMSGAHLAYADSAILNSINAGDIPGAVLAVVKDGKMAYLKAYGYRSIVPKREKMTTSTILAANLCQQRYAPWFLLSKESLDLATQWKISSRVSRIGHPQTVKTIPP